MEFGKRIKARREAIGMTQDELAAKMGYSSRSSIAKIESGTNDIPQSKIVAFATALNTTTSYLMNWSDDPASSAYEQAKNILPLPKTKKIPLLGTIACGEPIYADENIEEYLPVPEDVNADFCLRCKGDSMIGARIHDGDVVYIHAQDTVDNGQIAAVIIGDEATLKRVYISDRTIMLAAANEAYAPLVYVGPEAEKVRIIGRAVAFLSQVK
ncbi:MAG: helix-turn-helix domain-containing protein [Clostridia bacterium]|nr:helix-turn-helix domain-containing protein [Clostridia bacterium]